MRNKGWTTLDIKKYFTEHPLSIGETYWQHFWVAVKLAIQFFYIGVVLLIHAFLPFLFVTTGSDFIFKLHDKLVKRRGERTPSPD